MNNITQTSNHQKLIDGLNVDLVHEYAAMIQYIYNAAAVTGLSRQVLKPYFEAEARDEMNHAKYLAEKIINLGGTPEVHPAPIKQLRDAREIIQHALNEEIATIERYKARLKEADEVGDIALKNQLEEMIADETRHKEELQHLLQDSRF